MIGNVEPREYTGTLGQFPFWIEKALKFLKHFLGVEIGIDVVGTEYTDLSLDKRDLSENWFVHSVFLTDTRI